MGERDWARSAKKDAPSRREYQDLVRAAKRLDGNDSLKYTFTIRTMGELGLRAGEVSHMRKAWIDMKYGKIRIPDHDPCDHGRGGDVCGYCKSQTRQAVSYRPDELTFEEELQKRWKPKMEDSERVVPYNFDDSLMALYDMFFHRHDRYPWNRSAINRWVDDLAEESDMIASKEDIYPHAFRGRAARRFVTKGMRAHSLRKIMGWGSVEAAMEYIKLEANDVGEELNRIFDPNYEFDV